MRWFLYPLLTAFFVFLNPLPGVQKDSHDPVPGRLLGEAFLGGQGYVTLQELVDLTWDRSTGSSGNRLGLDLLEARLHSWGVETRREGFPMPYWIRGEVEIVEVLHPVRRAIRTVAMGYVEGHPRIEAEAVWVNQGRAEDYEGRQVAGKIGILAAHSSLNRQEQARLAREHGVLALLMTNREAGGQLLARVATFTGEPSPVPFYGITLEDGHWMRRLMEAGHPVRVAVETNAQIVHGEVENLVAVFPGLTEEKIVLGAHYDSWDNGQGAIDNGLGVAQLMEVARLFRSLHPVNHYTLELVWFNGEELGLWGSLAYVERHREASVRAMVNLDMVGRPTSVNALGLESTASFLGSWLSGLGEIALPGGVDNTPWLGSDHVPFLLAGIPSVTFGAHLDRERVRYYHDYADTFDKVPRRDLAEASAIVALLLYRMLNDTGMVWPRLDQSQVVALFDDHGLTERMKRLGIWPFQD